MQTEQNSLILTLKIDAASQKFFNDQRRRYFPPGRDHLSAHLTLFHQLPDVPETYNYLYSLVFVPFDMEVSGLMHLGAGVAYTLRSAELMGIHRELAANFQAALIPQDRQKFSPHITVQNKVTPEASKRLLAELKESFTPFSVKVVGLDLWEYLGGPWRHSFGYDFKNI